MAVKKQEAAEAAKEQQAENNTTQAEKAESGAGQGAQEQEKGKTVIYIGPTLPAGKLKCNRVLIGTDADIKKELEAVLEEYPLVEKLLVPVEELAEKKDKVRTAGNILNKCYSDLTSAIAANLKREV